MDRIIFDRMEFFGYHGVFFEENKLGQRFFVDLELVVDLRAAGASDKLEHTVNYASVYDSVKRIVTGERCKLIETVAERIASSLLATYGLIDRIKVRVTKPNPPFDVHFQGVSVEIERSKGA